MADQMGTSAHGPASVTTTLAYGTRRVPLTVSVPTDVAQGGQPVTGIVVIQEAFGIGGPMIGACERLAMQGHIAVAPHLYHRTAAAPLTDFDTARGHMAKLNGSDLAHDIADAREYLDAAGVPAARVGIVGFCMGGTIALWQASSGDFAAAVTFYGGGIATPRWKDVPLGLESGAALTCPWLGLYGDKDHSITTQQVEELRSVAAGSGMPTNILRYPNAGHAFANDPESPKYVRDAAVDAWAHAIEWLDAYLR